MATLHNVDYALHLPPKHAGELDQDEEWCEIEVDGERRRIRFHDYAQIYDMPGLYERLFADRLECDSPRVVADLLGDVLGECGERLDELSVGEIVGVDLLPEARDAAHRDRPGVYDDYYALDMTQLTPDQR